MKSKSKNLVLVVLLIAVMGMAVGYAALSQQLIINGTANITTQWDVHIKSITASGNNSSTGASEANGAPTFTGSSATFNVNLAYPGASATYILEVENAGSIDAKLQEVSGIDAANILEPQGITYSIDAKQNDTLTSKETKTYTVTVKWDASATEIPNTKSKTATITLNYVQAD